MHLSKFLLLQTASPDGIIRLERTALSSEMSNIRDIYFKEQCHHSIGDFLNCNIHGQITHSGLLMQASEIILYNL